MKKEKNSKIEKVIDASGKTLGRVASAAAVALMGKDKASFERHMYSGSPVRISNASKIRITTEKLEAIIHKRYSGYPGGLTLEPGSHVVKKKGYKELLRHAIQKMLPGNKLRREMLKNLKIEE